MASAPPDSRKRSENPLISIVVPVRDEEGCIEELGRRVRLSLAESNVRYEILFVDDGSRDRTLERVEALRASDPAVSWIRFTRSFGHQAALTAGLRHARGDAAVTMDGDLQHPPELLPRFIEVWRTGVDVVHSVRHTPRTLHTAVKDLLSGAFYRVLNWLSPLPILQGAADFRLLDRRVIDRFNSLQEVHVFARGMIPWLGFSEQRIDYQVGARHAGRSKYGFGRMGRLALDGIVSSSLLPLRAISVLGLVVMGTGLGAGLVALVAAPGAPIGWPHVMVLLGVLGGVQLVSIGILGEYVGRTHEEVRRRPRYVIESMCGLDGS